MGGGYEDEERHSGQTERERHRNQADTDASNVDPESPPGARARGELVARDPVALDDEVGDEVGEEEPGEGQRRGGDHDPDPGRAAATASSA